MLQIDQDEYNKLLKSAQYVTGPYIAVDASRSREMDDGEAVDLGDLWNDLREFEKRFEDYVFEECGELFHNCWVQAFGDEPLPQLGRMFTTAGGESEEWDFDDKLIEAALRRIRKYVIDQIYEIEDE